MELMEKLTLAQTFLLDVRVHAASDLCIQIEISRDAAYRLYEEASSVLSNHEIPMDRRVFTGASIGRVPQDSRGMLGVVGSRLGWSCLRRSCRAGQPVDANRNTRCLHQDRSKR